MAISSYSAFAMAAQNSQAFHREECQQLTELFSQRSTVWGSSSTLWRAFLEEASASRKLTPSPTKWDLEHKKWQGLWNHAVILCDGLWSREMCKNLQMCKQPHICANISPTKCANNHICANISPSNVLTTTFCANISPTNWIELNWIEFIIRKRKFVAHT